MGSLCGAIVWASLCDANKHSQPGNDNNIYAQPGKDNVKQTLFQPMRIIPGVQRAWFADASRWGCRLHLRIPCLLCWKGFLLNFLLIISFICLLCWKGFLSLSTLLRRFFLNCGLFFLLFVFFSEKVLNFLSIFSFISLLCPLHLRIPCLLCWKGFLWLLTLLERFLIRSVGFYFLQIDSKIL